MVNKAVLFSSIAVAIAVVFLGYLMIKPSSTIGNNVSLQSKVVRIALEPTQSPQELEEHATELKKYLEDKTGYKIVITVPTSAASVIEALRFNQTDVAFTSALGAYLATKKANATLELAEVRKVIIGNESRNEPYYYSYWVVLKDSPYKSLEDLRGKKVAFANPIDPSSYLMPLARLVELGYIHKEEGKEVDPKQFFSEVYFAGGYAQAWEALKNRQVDVTVIAGDVSAKLYWDVLNNTRIIEKQGPIPSHGVVFNKDLDPRVKESIKKALIELGNSEEGKNIMRKLVSALFVSFKETNAKEHLTSLNEALEKTGLRFEGNIEEEEEEEGK